MQNDIAALENNVEIFNEVKIYTYHMINKSHCWIFNLENYKIVFTCKPIYETLNQFYSQLSQAGNNLNVFQG